MGTPFVVAGCAPGSSAGGCPAIVRQGTDVGAGGEGLGTAWGEELALELITAAGGLFSYLGDVYMSGAGQRITSRIRADVFAYTQRLPMAFHDRWQSGQLLSRIMSDLATIRRFLGFGLLFILTNIAQILVTHIHRDHYTQAVALRRLGRIDEAVSLWSEALERYEDIGEVDPGRADPDQHLIGSDHRLVDLGEDLLRHRGDFVVFVRRLLHVVHRRRAAANCCPAAASPDRPWP